MNPEQATAVDMLLKLVSALAAVVALILIWRQLKQQSKLAEYDALTRIHEEIRTKRFTEALTCIHNPGKDVDNPTDPELVEAMQLVTGLYDLVGARVRAGALPERYLLHTEYKTLLPLWERVKKFVRQRREERGAYKEDFEWLVGRAQDYAKKNGIALISNPLEHSAGGESQDEK